MQNLEVFKSTYTLWVSNRGETILDLNCNHDHEDDETFEKGEGWFFWFSLPGCLPDSDAFGPYETPEEAKSEAEYMFGE